MAGFNIFKVYPAQVKALSQLLESKGMPLVDSKTVVDGNNSYEYALYFSHAPRPRTIKWIKELQKIFNVPTQNIESFSAVVIVTLEWVHWFNNTRLFEPIGNIPPAEFEKAYYTELHSLPVVAGLK